MLRVFQSFLNVLRLVYLLYLLAMRFGSAHPLRLITLYKLLDNFEIIDYLGSH